MFEIEDSLTNKDNSHPVLTGKIGPHAEFEGRNFLYFAGNNYLNLGGSPQLMEAAMEAVRQYGTSFGAGRTTTGTSDLHLRLEKVLADFKGAEDAMIFPSGYLGNQILLRDLVREGDTIFYDEWVHPSIMEGLPEWAKDRLPFKHNDAGSLQECSEGTRRGVVVVNGVDPCTGDVAPLDEIEEVIRGKDFRVLVDDAHSTGVLGENGRGTLEHYGISSDHFFQTETMSKALGSFGGFIASSREVISRLRKISPTYRGSTPLPPAVVGASITAVQIVQESPERREKLIENARVTSEKLKELGLNVSWHGTAIISVKEEESFSRQLSTSLQEKGIIIPFIRYPSADSPGRLRLTLSSGHTRQDIDQLHDAIRDVLSRRKE